MAAVSPAGPPPMTRQSSWGSLMRRSAHAVAGSSAACADGRLWRKGNMSWAAHILTLYPEMFPGPLGHSLAGRALAEGIWSLETVQIRDFAADRHRSVDDTPAGGGAGMVMRADVLAAAADSVLARRPAVPTLAMTPRGAPLSQGLVRELAAGPGVSILCGRFEGIDERLFEARPILPVSIGDYVLSGGEVAA